MGRHDEWLLNGRRITDVYHDTFEIVPLRLRSVLVRDAENKSGMIYIRIVPDTPDSESLRLIWEKRRLEKEKKLFRGIITHINRVAGTEDLYGFFGFPLEEKGTLLNIKGKYVWEYAIAFDDYEKSSRPIAKTEIPKRLSVEEVNKTKTEKRKAANAKRVEQEAFYGQRR